ncbi:hypothetical protein VNO80_02751 [Phaseolus coccineus]|uniref:Uncharacterized protein n=1 Tax=Phaseolus coccineus TaxID=3886 RepID=A0AAN9RRK3_PHACN
MAVKDRVGDRDTWIEGTRGVTCRVLSDPLRRDWFRISLPPFLARDPSQARDNNSIHQISVFVTLSSELCTRDVVKCSRRVHQCMRVKLLSDVRERDS